MSAESGGSVLILATMDTKGDEALYLSECVKELGLEALIMDPGIRGNPDFPVYVSRHKVASRGGTTLSDVQMIPHEGKALNAMIVGAISIARELYEQGRINGIVALGGSMGTTLGSAVMRDLPFGFPKVMISTMASRNTRSFVGTRDIVMLHSVCDLAGLNRMTRRVISNGAGAIAGMVNAGAKIRQERGKLRQVALSTLGTTETCAAWLREALTADGFEVVTFHTNGSGGQAMDEMIEEGEFDFVIDLSLHEIADHRYGGDYDSGALRGVAALRKGIPTILVPGNMDFLVTGPLADAQRRFPSRRYHSHNEAITVAETSPLEMEELGGSLAELSEMACGPALILVPSHGFSAFSDKKGPLYNPANTERFIKGLKDKLKSDSILKILPCHINDKDFYVNMLKCVRAMLN